MLSGFAVLLLGRIVQSTGTAIVLPLAFVAWQIRLRKRDQAYLEMRPSAIRSFSLAALSMLYFVTAMYKMMTLMPVIL